MSACPFCGGLADPHKCEACGRAPSASRRLCSACQQMTPLDEPSCCHCGKVIRSEMRWKIPVIIAMFVAAIGASIIVQVLLD